MLVRRVRRLARLERRDVNFELVERRGRRAHHLAYLAPVVGLGVGGRPFVDGGLLDVLLRDQRGQRAQGGGGGDEQRDLNFTHSGLPASSTPHPDNRSTRRGTRCPDTADPRSPASWSRIRWR